MKKIVFLYCILIFMTSFCTKKLISDKKEEVIRPEAKAEKQLQFSQFINQSDDPDLDIFEESIPEILKTNLSKIDKIRLAFDSVSLANEEEILKAQKWVQKIESNKINESLDELNDSSQSLLSSPVEPKKKQKPASRSKILNEMQKEISRQKNLNAEIVNYIKFYGKKRQPFKAYLGVNINKSLDIELNTFKFKVIDKILRLKTGKVFNVSHIYSQLSGNPSDIMVIGILKKRNTNVVIHIKLYDKHHHKFIWSKKFSFSKSKLNLDMEKKVKKISKALISKLVRLPKGKLIIQSKPKGAFVFLDNKFLGRSNLIKEIPIGYHKVEILKKGYKKVSGDIFLTRNKSQKLIFRLNQSIKTGSLVIESEPSGADIFVDLDYKGQTPLVIEKIRKGDYKIRLEKKGYRFSYSSINVKHNKKLLLRFKMSKGVTKYNDVENLSKSYNTAKNIFLYTSLLSTLAMVYAHLQVGKYQDRLVGEESLASPSASKLSEYRSKYNQGKKVRNATIISTIGFITLTAIFQILELHAEDIEVGFSPTEKEKPKPNHKDLGANLQVKIKF